MAVVHVHTFLATGSAKRQNAGINEAVSVLKNIKYTLMISFLFHKLTRII